ncbi:MAG: isocitrate/isopropylmalate family dehydrogenase, partial [Methanothrix sp.]|nr:isocitrate/isopropylmalate family dehydrogenase [Methanothrix sp.]
TIWAGALLLDHLGQPEAAASIVAAIERNLFEGRIKTYDLGGSSTTSEVGSEIARLVGLV